MKIDLKHNSEMDVLAIETTMTRKQQRTTVTVIARINEYVIYNETIEKTGTEVYPRQAAARAQRAVARFWDRG